MITKGAIYRHVKTNGTYKVIALGRLQISTPELDMIDMVVYQSEQDDSIWCRPLNEFEDGRFVLTHRNALR